MKPDEKGVIFSQFTSYLDIIGQELLKEGHTFCRIDGTMSADARQDSMERFDTEGCDSLRTPRFILCSLMAWYASCYYIGPSSDNSLTAELESILSAEMWYSSWTHGEFSCHPFHYS